MTLRKLGALGIGFAGIALAACAGHAVSSGGANLIPTMTSPNSIQLPSVDSDLSMTAVLPARTVGEELPSEGLGTKKSIQWKATIGGFTQTQFSQTLAFPPGTKITIRNLSKSLQHTLNVVKKISGPPADFPASPTLSTTAHGNGKLAVGYASGIIDPGKSRTVTLSTAGIYLIGCAFHYGEGMRDVFVVSKTAKPGPRATPPPAHTGSPSPKPTYPGGGWEGSSGP